MIVFVSNLIVCGQNKDQRIASLSYAFSNGNIDTTIRKVSE